jgi:asparagine synthase (glutamine-hydrolysing)
MCGIGGYVSKNYIIDDNSIDKMLQSLKHRGPDGYSVNESDFGFILHTRLSIIDTSDNGLQPFSIDNGLITSAHNGEIYNYKNLKKKLSKEIIYISNTDSEVIPYYYMSEGIDVLSKALEGMFAISILDKHRKKLYLIRDQFGIKPLYYSIAREGICFGSEIKAILTLFPDLKKDIEEQSIYDFLSLGYIVEPQTFYKQIFCVPAGSYLEYDIEKHSFKVINYVSSYDKIKENINILEIDQTVKRVIMEQSEADVPVASFLSGGVDSTLVSTYYAQTNKETKTFTVAFQAENRDESTIAAKTAEYLKTNHTTITPLTSYSEIELDSLIRHFDQPFGDLSIISTDILCKEVSKYVKVALSGDGGDEFVAGYNKFKMLWLLDAIPKVFHSSIKFVASKFFSGDSKYNRLLTLLDYSYTGRNFELTSYLREADLESFFNKKYESPERHFKWHEGYSIIQNTTLNQLSTSLVSKMLPKVDRISMLNKLEVRVPLLDQKLTTKLFKLRDNFKFNMNNSKIIYRELLKLNLPQYKKTKKVGFDIDQAELNKLGLTNVWINYLDKLKDNSTFYRIFSVGEIKKWQNDFNIRGNKKYSLQSQTQVIFHLYVIAKWLEWNEV